jgi:hypothetical protein
MRFAPLQPSCSSTTTFPHIRNTWLSDKDNERKEDEVFITPSGGDAAAAATTKTPATLDGW